MSPPFVLFGAAHLAVILLVFLAPALAAVAGRRRPAHDQLIRRALALLLLAYAGAWLVFLALRGTLGLGNALPLHLCDWAAIALIITLWRPNQLGYELGYFWGLGGTLHGLITPDLGWGFPTPEFFFFFVQHGGVIAALLYLTLGTGYRPTWASLPRVFAASFVYVAVAGGLNALLGTNYGFLRHKPVNPSILDLLHPWPWYVGELVLIGAVSAVIYYLPFALVDGLRGRKVQPERT